MAHTHNVFVYGTLRPNHGNNRRLLSGAVHIGKAVTTPADDFTMYLSNLGGGIPFVVPHKHNVFKSYENQPMITGDLYQVNDEELGALDSLEGHPRWYCREEINIKVKTGDKYVSTTAWIYLMPERLLDTNIVNLSGDFDEVSTYSDNSHLVLNSVR